METKWSVYYPNNFSAEDLTDSSTLYSRLMRVCGIYRERTALEYMGSKMSYAALARRNLGTRLAKRPWPQVNTLTRRSEITS